MHFRVLPILRQEDRRLLCSSQFPFLLTRSHGATLGLSQTLSYIQQQAVFSREARLEVVSKFVIVHENDVYRLSVKDLLAEIRQRYRLTEKPILETPPGELPALA